MAYPAYIREKARQLRRERQMTIDEIAERLALSRTTIYYWVRNLPIPRTTYQSLARQRASKAAQAKYRKRRETAYRQGLHGFHALNEIPGFRDFVLLFMTEGYRRSRNTVAIGNSDPAIVELATGWIRLLSRNKVTFSLQFHADQDLSMLRGFWANRLGVHPDAIRPQRKSNSSGLATRTWRSQFGVLTVRSSDTYLRVRLDAWMDCVRRQWLDSPKAGV